MVAALTFVCLVTLIKGTTHVPVTLGHNLIKMGTTALVRQHNDCLQDVGIVCIHVNIV